MDGRRGTSGSAARAGSIACFGSRFAIVAACALAAVLSATPARAQPDSPAAMRQRIAALESDLARLQSDLEATRAERDRLLIEVEQLRRAMVGGGPTDGGETDSQGAGGNQTGGGDRATRPGSAAPRQMEAGDDDGPPASVPISALSRDPLDSPDALFVALLLDYREAFAADPTAPAIPDRDAVEDWVRASSAAFEGTTTWLVRIDGIVRDAKGPDANARRQERRLLATVLDPATLMPISRPAMIDIPRRLDGRFPDALAAGETLFAEMRVAVEAACVFQPTRESEGPFNYPPFIGPYAGFGYTVDMVGLKFEELGDLQNRARELRKPSSR